MLTPEKLRSLEWARWIILRAAEQGGHYGATETMARMVVSEDFPMSRDQIRAEIHYLEERELLRVEKNPVKPWRIFLTNHGRDFVDGSIDARPGIYRPQTGE